MKIKNFIFIFIISLLLSGCGIGAKSYEVFERNRDINIGNKMLGRDKFLQKKEYDNKHYIYIYNNILPDLDGRCVFGYIVEKNDPKQISIDWEILSGKEYCKEQQKWILSF